MSEHPDYEAIHTTAKAEEHIQEAHQTLEELVREHEKAKDEKAAAMKEYSDEIKEIESRMEGQLRVLDALRDRRNCIETQPELPFDKAPADGSGDVVKAQDGSVHAGEEMFATAGTPLEGEEPEDANVIPLLTAHREEPVSSESFMADGMEPAPADDDTLRLDDEESEMLGKGDVESAKQLYVLRTGAEDAVADAEIKAWQAAAASLAAAKARAAGRKNNATPKMARCNICQALVFLRDRKSHLREVHIRYGGHVDYWFSRVVEDRSE